jgi:hypothetical protein
MESHRVLPHTNAQYVHAIEMHCVSIFEIYLLYEKTKPVMLLDVTEGKIYAYPYDKFKMDLNPDGQVSLTKQYEQAVRRGEFVIFVRDSHERKLISYSSGSFGSSTQSNDELNELELVATSAAHKGGSCSTGYAAPVEGGSLWSKRIQRSSRHWNRNSKTRWRATR